MKTNTELRRVIMRAAWREYQDSQSPLFFARTFADCLKSAWSDRSKYADWLADQKKRDEKKAEKAMAKSHRGPEYIDICSILLNDSKTEHQIISYNVADHKLYTDADCWAEPVDDTTYSTIDEAEDACHAMWGYYGWDFEWIEREDDDNV